MRAVRLPAGPRPVRLEDARFLSADDLARVCRYRQPADQWRTLLGRALVISALRDEFGIEQPAFGISLRGRPSLAASARDATTPAPDFNVSHAGDWVVCALSASGRVGIDVAPIADFHDWPGLQAHFLSERERTAISRASASEQQTLAARYWTLKEAIVKCAGSGLEVDPRLVEIDLHRGPELLSSRTDLPDPRALMLIEPALDAEHRLALAVSGAGIGPQAGPRVEVTTFGTTELLALLCL